MGYNTKRRWEKAPLTSSESLINILKNFARCICLADNSPRPEKSVRYSDVHESTMRRANLRTDTHRLLAVEILSDIVRPAVPTWIPPSSH